MPVCLSRDSSGRHPWSARGEVTGFDFQENSPQCIDIGLLNNMPDSALQSTERQFMTLLNAAADGVAVRLSLFALPEVPRSDVGRSHIGNFYSGTEDLWNRHLDGLIVTGTEPRTSNLRDEPYWASMTAVIDWAEHNTHSTVWSCLAAHAAVLHMDGISRRRLDDKRFGLFECAPVEDHRLTEGIPSRVVMPHSRWNDLPEKDLLDSGYRTLMRSHSAGVDTFVKTGKSLSLFFQGHPEYEANTLWLEYRRDIGRYLKCERDTYPTMPSGYFDQDTVDILALAQERAVRDRRLEILAEFPHSRVEKNLAKTWDPSALRIYGNWLTYLCGQKERRLRQTQIRKAAGTNGIGLRRRAAAV